MTDVARLIEKDHREVEGLFAKFNATGDDAIAAQICDELDLHTAAEEKVVYPVIASDLARGDEIAREAEEEHKEARQLIGRIRQTSDPDHMAKLVAELKQAVEHHVKEEETEILPKLRKTVDAGRLDQLGEEFEAAKG